MTATTPEPGAPPAESNPADAVAFTAIQEGHLPATHRPEAGSGGPDVPGDTDAQAAAEAKAPRKQAVKKQSKSGKLELRTAVSRPSLEVAPVEALAEVGVAWYVVRVASGREGSVKKALERKVREENLGDQIVAIHVPTEDVVEVRDSKKRVVKRKLYPGYVILEMVINEATQNVIRRTSGVGDFVALQPMSEREIDQISRAIRIKQETKTKPEIKITLALGQKIKVKEGAFENFEGKVLEVNADKGVVKVGVEIFGRQTEVELEYWQVEAI